MDNFFAILKDMSTEKSTQAAIMQYLSLKKCLFWRQNSGAFKDNKGHFYKFSSINGLPDIFCLKDSVLYGIEVKDIKGVLNENQKDFAVSFIKNGGEYIVARSVEDVAKMI